MVLGHPSPPLPGHCSTSQLTGTRWVDIPPSLHPLLSRATSLSLLTAWLEPLREEWQVPTTDGAYGSADFEYGGEEDGLDSHAMLLTAPGSIHTHYTLHYARHRHSPPTHAD